MKRTGEFSLGLIGTIISALMTVFGLFFMSLMKTDEVMEMVEDSITSDPLVNPDEVNMLIQFMMGFGWVFIIASLLGIIFGIIGVFNIKGDKKPKLAGWMYIIGGVLIGVLTIGLGFVPAILFLIAGIMCLVRKAPIEPQEPAPY